MATAVATTFNTESHIDKVDFAHKMEKMEKLQAPGSPDGAGADAPPSPTLQKKNTVLEVTPSTSQVDTKPAETRRATIRRLASRAFEAQTGKEVSDDMSEAEWAIYNAEVAKSEAIMDKKKADDEAAAQLATQIKNREGLLIQLTNELGRKVELYQLGQAELEKVTADFEAALKEHVSAMPAASGPVKSSSARMQEEKEKKALKAQWRRSTSDDPVARVRQRQFAAAEEITSLKARIEELRKETGRMKGQATKGKSSSHRMQEEKLKKKEIRESAAVNPPSNEPAKVYVVRPPPERSHKQRMADEQAKKAEARRQARMSLDASDLVGRPRSTTAY